MIISALDHGGGFFVAFEIMRGIFRHIVAVAAVFVTCAGAHGAGYRAVMVADMDTGRVLYSENSNDLNYPASLTKIMTLYLTFDALEHGRLHLDDYLIVSQSAANASPVKLGLAAGSKIKVEDAIKAVAVVSANDVARVLAENLKGLAKTHFENSSGLPNDDHMSTARDIALLSMAVYKHFPQYWKYFGIKTWTYNGKTYTNGNRLLGTYPGCDGMKTGFTNKSKYSLVATAKRDGHHLMSVVLGAENKDVRAAVATNMLNKGFNMLGTNAAPVVKNSPVAARQPAGTVPASAATGVAAPVTKTAGTVPVQALSDVHGTAGVQFGAFSSRGAAAAQAARVKQVLGSGVVVDIEPSGDLFRVRMNGLSDAAAGNIKSHAAAAGIDCYIFH